ncbi:hypothetical protein [Sphingobium yanoikuyae]|uniref:hypothetical protein n=1 Tax=Sphingobium yanoikuyae TaxID=13690 RepID=UPI0028B2580D|nr:hypothetical protein [Sphingobium yanoikuyae]
MIPPIAALVAANALLRAARKPCDHCGAEGTVAGAFKHGLRAVGIGSCLIANDLETGDPLLERRIIQIGHTRLDGVV